ncbi:hypothetical protein AK812_SmicGene21066 [Symbiodinium microadriaticum]|uniref:Uncharacterized protein n=1 Tax=Symbiodinium microadriaticum TaxID=2951 RepID=A0A1Q9DNH6_SYMMI|nr:hypothetical protein AK812_SmicGene21066 [Symbiodinium microadriaticum]
MGTTNCVSYRADAEKCQQGYHWQKWATLLRLLRQQWPWLQLRLLGLCRRDRHAQTDNWVLGCTSLWERRGLSMAHTLVTNAFFQVSAAPVRDVVPVICNELCSSEDISWADRFSHNLIQATPIPEGHLYGAPAVPAVNLQADVATVVRVPKRQTVKISSPKRLVELLSLASRLTARLQKKSGTRRIRYWASRRAPRIKSTAGPTSDSVLHLEQINKYTSRRVAKVEQSEVQEGAVYQNLIYRLPVAAADTATEAEVADTGCLEIQRRCSGYKGLLASAESALYLPDVQAVSSMLQAEEDRSNLRTNLFNLTRTLVARWRLAKYTGYTLPGGWLYLPGEYK